VCVCVCAAVKVICVLSHYSMRLALYGAVMHPQICLLTRQLNPILGVGVTLEVDLEAVTSCSAVDMFEGN
jgi:hypothetical protein